jgi:hypothetical protein
MCVVDLLLIGKHAIVLVVALCRQRNYNLASRISFTIIVLMLYGNKYLRGTVVANFNRAEQ